MNRKDTIIVATLINVAVLAVLFITAVNGRDDPIYETPEIAQAIATAEPEIKIDQMSSTSVPIQPSTESKFDFLLSDLDSDLDAAISDDEWTLFADTTYATPASPDIPVVSSNIVEIAVKKGDSLERIARANGTSVSSLTQLNGLKSDRLKIGQLLQVDVGSSKKSVLAQSTEKPAAPVSTEAVYYTLKSGDSPWKVAKQFHVNMDDLLQLNKLDEEKARNLKIGDKIRVK